MALLSSRHLGKDGVEGLATQQRTAPRSGQNRPNLGGCIVDFVVGDEVIKLFCCRKLLTRCQQPAGDRLFALGATVPQPLHHQRRSPHRP